MITEPLLRRKFLAHVAFFSQCLRQFLQLRCYGRVASVRREPPAVIIVDQEVLQPCPSRRWGDTVGANDLQTQRWCDSGIHPDQTGSAQAEVQSPLAYGRSQGATSMLAIVRSRSEEQVGNKLHCCEMDPARQFAPVTHPVWGAARFRITYRTTLTPHDRPPSFPFRSQLILAS